MKKLVHSLTAGDALRDAPKHATVEELALFADDDAEWDQTKWKRLWDAEALPADDERCKVPTSWTIERRMPEGDTANRKWKDVRKACIAERDWRAQPGNAYAPNVLSSTMLQLPKGEVHDREDKWVAAQRELEEEAGVSPGEIDRLPGDDPAQPCPALTSGSFHAYVCCITRDDKAATELESWPMHDSKETTGAEWVNLDLLGKRNQDNETSVPGGIYLPKKEKTVVSKLQSHPLRECWQQQLAAPPPPVPPPVQPPTQPQVQPAAHVQ